MEVSSNVLGILVIQREFVLIATDFVAIEELL